MFKKKYIAALVLFLTFNSSFLAEIKEKKTIQKDITTEINIIPQHFRAHLDSLLCLYATEGQHLLQNLSGEEITKTEAIYQSKEKNNTISQEITAIQSALQEIKNAVQKKAHAASQESFFTKIKEYLFPQTPAYITNFLKQITKAEKTSQVTEAMVDKYLFYITFFLKYAAMYQKNIFDTSSFNTLSLLKTHTKSHHFFSLSHHFFSFSSNKKESYPVGYPTFDYKKIYTDLFATKSFFNTKNILLSLAFSIATGTALSLRNNYFLQGKENNQESPKENNQELPLEKADQEKNQPTHQEKNHYEEKNNYTFFSEEKEKLIGAALITARLLSRSHRRLFSTVTSLFKRPNMPLKKPYLKLEKKDLKLYQTEKDFYSINRVYKSPFA